MRLDSLFLACISLSIVASGFSVSISQGFLGLGIILGCFKVLRKPSSLLLLKQNPTLVWAGIFFLGCLINVGIHWILAGGSWDYLSRAFRQEPKDVFLFFAALLVLGIRKEDLPAIQKSFLVLTILMVVAGLVSIFSEYRLGWLISQNFKEMKTWGKQHFLGEFFGVRIFLPIGLMNTHLTYGGIAMLLYPYVFFRLLTSFFQKQEKHSLKTLVWFLFFVVFTLVFLLNNARSAIFGVVLSLLVGLYLWRERGNPFFPPWILVAVSFLCLASGILLWNKSDAFRRVMGPLIGYEKHTDSGRTFIWSSSLPLALENPIFGVGPGNYAMEIENSRKKLSLEYPELLFFYETTQRGHSHNDYIHLAAVYGFPVLILYLLFYYSLIRDLVQSSIPFPEWAWFLGFLGLGIASLFQCYFQDDEVVIVFWYLVGYFGKLQSEEKSV